MEPCPRTNTDLKRCIKHKAFYLFKQDKYTTDSDYLENFCTFVEVCESTDCKIGEFRILATKNMMEKGMDFAASTPEQQQIALDVTKE